MDDAGWRVEVCSGRFRKGFIWTVRVGMWRFAQDDFVKVFVWTMRGDMWRFASDDFVKALSGRSGEACGGLLRTIS